MKKHHQAILVALAFSVTRWGVAAEVTPAKVRAELKNAGVDCQELRVEEDGGLYLSLANTSVSNLTFLSGIPITGLNLSDCRNVTNLAPLVELPLDFLNITGTRVTDLSPLENMPLRNFFFSPEIAINNLSAIRRSVSCININQKSPSQFWKEYDSDAATRLRRVGIAYHRLVVLTNGLWSVSLANTSITNLSALSNMPISDLCLSETPVSDISPLRGMPLVQLDLTYTHVKDLTPLRGMKLQWLFLRRVPARDFSPLKGLPLKSLDLDETSVSDLSPLAGMPLEWLSIGATQVTDLSPLHALPLTVLLLPDTRVENLSSLQGLRLARLRITNTRISDLTPLTNVPLQSLLFSPHAISTGLDMLRHKTSLKEIGIEWDQLWPPDLFWKKFDSGELERPGRAEQESGPIRK